MLIPFTKKPKPSAGTIILAVLLPRNGVFDGNVTSQSYLAMLNSFFWPELTERGFQDDAIFMQDGAPPHFGLIVRQWLNDRFPERWMGRSSPNMPWPPRSPDLTPCDFFLWGFIKDKVYTTRPRDLLELKDRIRTAFNEITVEMRFKTALQYKERLQQVLENGGSHVECYSR